MLTNEIIGMEVIGSSGFKLGRITDTESDEKTWKVNSIQVHLEKDVAEEHELRHRFRRTLVLINIDHVQAVGDKVILKGSREDLLKLIASATAVQEELPQEKDQNQIEADSPLGVEMPKA